MNQGKSVARLNVVAFIFLPLSFVAVSYSRLLVSTRLSVSDAFQSVFGITTWDIAAHWYPAAAVPVLALTIATALLVNRFAAHRESIKLYPSHRKIASVATEPIFTSQPTFIPTIQAAAPLPVKAPPPSRNYDLERLPRIARARSPSPRGHFEERSSFIEAQYELGSSNPRASGAILSDRPRVVSRVDSDRLRPEDNVQRQSFYRNAAPGARNAPSGLLTHDV
jgi:hypothetical protein